MSDCMVDYSPLRTFAWRGGSLPPDANPDDLLDISGVGGARQYFDSQGFDLTAGALGGGNKIPSLDANGNADQVRGDENDARLLVEPKSNLVPYHLLNALGTPTSLGTCFAGVDSQGAPCVK